NVLQAPGVPPADANQQGAQPSDILPAAPDKPRYTADTTWGFNKFFRNRPGPREGPEPPAPPPAPQRETRIAKPQPIKKSKAKGQEICSS
ncbi:MAG: hypothetical protein ACKPKO_50610, partial [Candidatus Fonsibacter sp.]